MIQLKRGKTYDFINFVHKKYKKVLNPVLKSGNLKDTTAQIKVFNNPIDSSDKTTYYFVGLKRSINKFKLDKSIHIKGLRPIQCDSLFTSFIISQLNVDFVRLEEYTVYPFPMKYLNEFSHLRKNKESRT